MYSHYNINVTHPPETNLAQTPVFTCTPQTWTRALLLETIVWKEKGEENRFILPKNIFDATKVDNTSLIQPI